MPSDRTKRGEVMSDRTVHASYSGAEVVRYDRAGKWWLEYDNGARERLTLADAAHHALWAMKHGGAVFAGRPGGAAFDRKVRDGTLRGLA